MKDKKIYIVTFSGKQNYGSLLQATALSRSLQNMGYEVSLLGRWKVYSYMLIHPSLFLARVINKLNLRRNREFFRPVPYELSESRIQRIEKYREDNFYFEDIVTKEDWRRIIHSNATFVSGSDIIWQPANGYPAKYFLDFVYYTKLNRFSYASSFGATELPKEYYHAYKKYLSKFSGISVREESSAKMLSDIIGLPVQRVVDPTMLLTREQWDEYAAKAQFDNVLPEKYILCYFVMDDERYWKYVKKVIETTNLPVVVLPMHYSDEDQPYTIIDDASPYEFIQLIKEAEIVCTDSFHACVFSTIYEKEFYLLRRSRKDEDAKYDDFLARYDLKSREVKNENIFERDKCFDFTEIKQMIEKDRKQSIKYIKSCFGQRS